MATTTMIREIHFPLGVRPMILATGPWRLKEKVSTQNHTLYPPFCIRGPVAKVPVAKQTGTGS